MRHYADLIFYFGPLSRLWTHNFEANHSWLRQVAMTPKKFVHVTKTIVQKHQLFFVYLFIGVMFPEDAGCSSLKPLDYSEFSARQILAIEQSGLDAEGAQFVKVVGTPPVDYKKGLWIVLKHNDAGLV